MRIPNDLRRLWSERTYEGPPVPLEGDFDWESTDKETISVALEEAQRAAEVESGRAGRLDDKASVLAGFGGVILALLVGLVSRTRIDLHGTWLTLFTIGFFASALLVLASASLAVSMLLPRRMLAIGPRELLQYVQSPDDPTFLQADVRALSVRMLRLYVTVIHFNQWRAERKSIVLRLAYGAFALGLVPLALVVATVGHGAVT
jgi:hypothetical protein